MSGPAETRLSAGERARAWELSHGEPIDDVAAMAFHLRARVGLGRALGLLDGEGIAALVVKGALLAHTLYASPIDRPIRDVDLRVPPRDLDRAVRVLAAAPGARSLVSSRVYGNAVLSLDRVEIDLESTIGPPFVCAIGVDAMLARAERTDAALGFAHRRPELHDHALLLLVNAFKDRLVDRAGVHARDLGRIARLPGFDVVTLASRADEARCRTLVHIVARHLGERGNDEAWRAIASRIAPVRRRYAERVLASLQGGEGPTSAWTRAAVRACSDSRARSLAAVGASAFFELEVATDRFR